MIRGKHFSFQWIAAVLVLFCGLVLVLMDQPVLLLLQQRPFTAEALQTTIRPRTRTTTRSRLFSSKAVTIEDAPTMEVPTSMERVDTIVCGAGPAGLLSAIMLAQKFPTKKVTVFDRLSEPPSPTDESIWSDVAKFYLIGLGARGQRSLAKFGVWEEVEAVCTSVVGRRDWSPEDPNGVERIFTDRPVTTQVLPRDKLVGVLHQHILENYPDRIELNFGYEVTPIDFAAGDGSEVVVQVTKCSSAADENSSARANPTSTSGTPAAFVVASDQADTLCDAEGEPTVVTTRLLVAADGTARTVANTMEAVDRERWNSMNPISRLFAPKPFTVTRYDDDNQRIYKTIPLELPSDWRPDLNYSARSKGGRVTLDALPANRKGNYCAVLLLRGSDALAQPDTAPADLRALLDNALPQFSPLVSDQVLTEVAQKPPSYLPAFRYVSPRLHQGDRTIILGDCAHTVKPYFGLGANSALEDVKFLSDAIDSAMATNNRKTTEKIDGNKDEDDDDYLTQAVHSFSHRMAGEAKALVRISRDLDRPGKLGFLTFILPLILDSIFSKLAPSIFSPNVITMLQKEGYGFQQVARRKRQDRWLQATLLASVLATMGLAGRYAIISAARLLGQRTSTVLGGSMAVVAAALVAKKLAGYLVPGMAPADILTKTKSTVTDSAETVESGLDADKNRQVNMR